MATLLVPWFGLTHSAETVPNASALPEWLGDDWALLFSHPGDFSSDGFECDRWLSILHDEFQHRGVRPVALGRSASQRDRSWVSEVIADDALLTLESPAQHAAADSLRQLLENIDGHYVFIIDSDLECQGIQKYRRSSAERLSPLDLLGTVDTIRHRQSWRAPSFSARGVPARHLASHPL
jgi:alkyl hydroperoxide reductase subunit AhpC